MPTLSAEISNIVQGDYLDIVRNIGNLPIAITKAWFTVKTRANLTTTSDGTNVVFQKAITTGTGAGVGVISDTGGSGTAIVRFELTNADTVLLTGDTIFYYDIQVLTSNGKIYTPEKGIIKMKQEITRSTS
jgi:hypothetical protein